MQEDLASRISMLLGVNAESVTFASMKHALLGPTVLISTIIVMVSYFPVLQSRPEKRKLGESSLY